ncbi:MAG: DUF3822 family protein [Chitinophagaceae bacterium]|nr:DUF3822 family protein [Chitinophagaceae bacterium]
MKKIFNIENNQISGDTLKLVSIGEDWICEATTDPAFSSLGTLSFSVTENGKWSAPELNDLPASENKNHSFLKTLVVLEQPDSILVPESVFRHEHIPVYLESAFGIKPGSYKSDYIPAWQLYNVYALPDGLEQAISLHWPGAVINQRFTVMLRNSNASLQDGQLLVEIRRKDIMVMALQNGKLLLSRGFDYSNPDDILHALLSVCAQTGFKQETVSLDISGLIDRDSALYKELYQYFIGINFRDCNWQTGDYPSHYFSSLKDISSCVS